MDNQNLPEFCSKFYCKICNCYTKQNTYYKKHLNTKKHKLNFLKLNDKEIINILLNQNAELVKQNTEINEAIKNKINCNLTFNRNIKDQENLLKMIKESYNIIF